MSITTDEKPVNKFTDRYNNEYFIDKRACNTLNKVLNTKFKSVYRQEGSFKGGQWSFPKINMDFETVYVLRDDDKVVSMQVSEWFTMSVED